MKAAVRMRGKSKKYRNAQRFQVYPSADKLRGLSPEKIEEWYAHVDAIRRGKRFRGVKHG